MKLPPASMERIAEAICQAAGIDPNTQCYAVRDETKAKLGEKYKAWEYQIPIAQAALDAVMGTEEIEALFFAIGCMIHEMSIDGYWNAKRVAAENLSKATEPFQPKEADDANV